VFANVLTGYSFVGVWTVKVWLAFALDTTHGGKHILSPFSDAIAFGMHTSCTVACSTDQMW
jgi:hypothetical protein